MSESTAGSGPVQSDGGTVPGSGRWSLLMVRIAAGDTGALSEFYDEANRYVHAIAMRILRDPDEADEVTLDVFQQVWRLAGSYNPERCAVGAWIGMMTRSRALDRWRSLQSRRRYLAAEPPDEAGHVSTAAGPDSLFAAGRQEETVRRALTRLPDEQRTVIVLAFWEGLSHSEVAARTGLPLGTVKTRIRLGMLKLREELDDAAG